jgi:hypothetical protein
LGESPGNLVEGKQLIPMTPVTFLKWAEFRNQGQIKSFQGFRARRGNVGGIWGDYRKATGGILVLALFSIFTVGVDTQTYTGTKIIHNTHTSKTR